MSEKKFPFYFTLEDNLIHSENVFDFNCNFFKVKINQREVIIGQCPKRFNKYDLKQIDDAIKNYKKFWNNHELKEISLFFKKKKYLRLYEWLCVRILLKTGLLLYWKYGNFDLNVNPEKIDLLKNQLNKPFIYLLIESNPDYIPFISISHSKKDVFIAICSSPIGIDCEVISNHSIYWKKKVFSIQELETFFYQFKKLVHIPNDSIYTLMWSLKESALKIGNNISLGLISKISIQLLDGCIITKLIHTNQTYQGFFSFNQDSVLTLTI